MNINPNYRQSYSQKTSRKRSNRKMNITDIKIRKLLSDGRLRAIVSITLDDTIALHDIKIIEGPNRLFVAMPSRRDDNGVFRDIVHPISATGRESLESEIIEAYESYLEENKRTIEYDQ